ncbi:MAG TPA: hypothetical protein VJ063_05445, partial [Verrucomicrobiae bacterium]|nr:hypothetical protein [Verrucomicrobiae bacterium]
NQWGGVHTRKADIGGDAAGVVTTELFARAAFGHGQREFAVHLLQLAAEAPRQARLPGGMSETIPPGGSDFVQLWSAGPFLEAIIEGLAGVLPSATPHHADFIPQLPVGLASWKLAHLCAGEHEFTLDQRRTGSRNIATLKHERGPMPFHVRFFSTTNAQFTANGVSLVSQLAADDPPRNGRFVSCDLAPGASLIVTYLDRTPLPCLLVPSDGLWKYLDDGSDQGTAWRTANFNDAAWPSGEAPFGYGDGDEATLVRSNRTDNSRIITTYFRKSFVVTNTWMMTNLSLNVLRDDGAIAYLNGVEVFRSNMPGGGVTFGTPALLAVGGGEEAFWFSTNSSPTLLVEGTNVLAVEIHQQSTASSDVSFNLGLNSVGFDHIELTARKVGSGFEIAWPLFPAGFVPESTGALAPDATWDRDTHVITLTNDERQIRFDPPPLVPRFYRLSRP